MSHHFQVSYTALGMSDDNQTSYSLPSVASSSRAARNVNFNDDQNDTATMAGFPPQQLPPPARRSSKLFQFQRPRSMSAWSNISHSSMKLDER